MKLRRNIYLDYAASAPMSRGLLRAKSKIEKSLWGNASSIHKIGKITKEVLEDSRKSVAQILSAHPSEVFFATTGTEADNMAILGVFEKAVSQNPLMNHIVTVETEHPAVLERYRYLESKGAQVTYLPVGPDGLVDPKLLRNTLTKNTVLVSVMYANNEIGVVQPIREIAKEIRHFRKNNNSTYPLFHTDACQAMQYLNVRVDQLGIDLLTFSGIKIGGGHGAGVLYVKKDTPISPIIFGGEQERGLHPGTENVPAIFALTYALKESRNEKENLRLKSLQEYLFERLEKDFPHARINGSKTERLPSNVNVSFPHFASELLVLELDAKNIFVSSGSACGSPKTKTSSVLKALYGEGDEKKYGTIRITFGKDTNKKDIDMLIRNLKNIFVKYKNLL